MKVNDPSNIRLQAAKSMIDKLGPNDRVCIMDFGATANVLTPFTQDKNLAKNRISGIGNDGMTALNQAMGVANSQFAAYSTRKSAYKLMVVLTDGENNVSGPSKEQIVEGALNNGVTIYTVGLGSSVNTNELVYISRNTNGRYYNTALVSGLNQVFDDLTQENIDFTTDSDGDGISDYFEDNLHRLFNGVQINLDKNNPDTDGDGLKDGEEVTVAVIDDIVFFRMDSNPNMIDTDGDGLQDNVDPEPLVVNN